MESELLKRIEQFLSESLHVGLQTEQRLLAIQMAIVHLAQELGRQGALDLTALCERLKIDMDNPSSIDERSVVITVLSEIANSIRAESKRWRRTSH